MSAAPLPDVMAAIADHGEAHPRAYRCRCGAEVTHPLGACEECSLRYEWDQIRDLMANARESIPPRFRWASLERPEEIAEMEGDGKRIGRRSVDLVRHIPKPLPCGIALVGASGGGKTTLACALLNWVHSHARPLEPKPGDAQKQAAAIKHWMLSIERARRAFFVSALELDGKGPEVDKLLDRAMRASVLVLDNLEPGATTGPVGRVLFHRHNQVDSRRKATSPRLVTIVTTWMDRAECAKSYGDGVARRAYEWTVELKPEVIR